MKMRVLIFTGIILVVILSGCFSISFRGTTIDDSIKTFSVQYFDNRVQQKQSQYNQIVEPTFSQRFTQALIDYIERNTNLRYINGMGDVNFSGNIEDYYISPQSFTSGSAAMTRFTIGVKVKYTNNINPDDDFDRALSAYREFNTTTSFNSVQSDLSDELIDEIVELIFNAAFVNW